MANNVFSNESTKHIKFHRTVGILLACYYLLFFTGNLDMSSGFLYAADASGNSSSSHASRGILNVYLFAIVGCLLLIFPRRSSFKFSPRTKLLKDRILTSGFFVTCGYILNVINFFIIKLFAAVY